MCLLSLFITRWQVSIKLNPRIVSLLILYCCCREFHSYPKIFNCYSNVGNFQNNRSKMQSGEILTHLVNNQVVNMARRKNTIGFRANYEALQYKISIYLVEVLKLHPGNKVSSVNFIHSLNICISDLSKNKKFSLNSLFCMHFPFFSETSLQQK